jgi:hypothetical protein
VLPRKNVVFFHIFVLFISSEHLLMDGKCMALAMRLVGYQGARKKPATRVSIMGAETQCDQATG